MAEFLVLSADSNPSSLREDAPGIVITSGHQDGLAQVWTAGAAAAMPVLYVPDIHITAKAL